MSMPNGVGYADITHLVQTYAHAGETYRQVAQEIVGQVTVDIAALAQQYAPVRTGELKGSIVSYTDNHGLTGIVTATAPYALFVELGTGTRGEFPRSEITIRPKRAKMLSWIDPSTGRRVYAKVVHSPGMRSRPFLRPALEQVVGDLQNRLGVAAIMTIAHGPGSSS